MSNNRCIASLFVCVALLCPAAANAAISAPVAVGTISAAASSGTGTISITPASAIASGSVIEVYTVQNSSTNSGCTGVTDASGNTYTKEITDANPGIWSNTFYGVITTALTTSDTISVACAVTTVARAAAAVAFTGANVASPYDATASASNGTTTPTLAPTVTQPASNSQLGQIVIGSGYINISATGVSLDTWTNVIDFPDSNTNYRIEMSYILLPATTAAQTWALTLTSARAYNFFVDAFKPAAAGGSTPHTLSTLGVGH